MIESGVILVNGEVCTVLGTLVGPNDKVQFGGQTLSAEKKVYLLMNKPKGYITTSDDPQDRKTVMELVADACRERIYPVGRLDRNTTGVLLFTNDGDIAKNLTHPSHGARKIYHVTLDRPLAKSDLSAISKGVMLEDGLTEVDEISYVEEGDRKEVGIQLHSGKNRIVRRIFEHFGYEVTKLDRVLFAELTKKDLKRGQWRFLTEQEINFLKVNAGGKAMAKKAKVEKHEMFTAEQLAEAEALAEEEEAPVKKRATRKKAEAEPE
ncbi:MAG: rRNA pseudouridine synthase, partial [Bacteroides sp.]|nr:rRNA pseudouridine synthase [Bacteroides sp.]